MGNKGFFRINQIALTGAAFIWVVGFVLYWAYHNMGTNYWVGFAFGILGLVAAIVGTVYIGRTNMSTQETKGIPLYYTSIYAVIVVALNIKFAFTPGNLYVTLYVVANLFILLVYALLMYNAGRYIESVTKRTEYAAAKMEKVVNISKELATLIGISTDEGVRRELLKLKEKVDYSNNVSQSFTEQSEDIFLEKLYDIRDAMSNGIGADIITAKVKDAEMAWNIRNSKSGALR
ncbi:MAG: hypothetical protein HDR03_08315 [Lachnospiraceae bacterium]|nr:hypothetical protein [Lachnospiraceae bacterium]